MNIALYGFHGMISWPRVSQVIIDYVMSAELNHELVWSLLGQEAMIIDSNLAEVWYLFLAFLKIVQATSMSK